ncbi:MAG: TrmH family RNA methyltransferase [Patescibacteria group bacterium]
MIVALENIRSLWNIGAILRTAEFFGIKEVWLVGYTGRELAGWDELHHKIGKTALGAEKNLKIKFLRDSLQLIKLAKEKKKVLVAIEQDKQAIDLREWQAKENSVLVLGSETEGVSKEILGAAEQIVEIPRLGKKNSLNVATVAGIVLAKVSLFN